MENIKLEFNQKTFLVLPNIKQKVLMACYNLLMMRNTDNAVINKDNAINNAKNKIIALEWYVPHYTPSITQQNILLNQIKKKIATELQYPETSVFMKKVNTQNFWNFELGVQEGIKVPKWIFLVFQQNDMHYNQNLSKETFYRIPVTSAQCIVGKLS